MKRESSRDRQSKPRGKPNLWWRTPVIASLRRAYMRGRWRLVRWGPTVKVWLGVGAILALILIIAITTSRVPQPVPQINIQSQTFNITNFLKLQDATMEKKGETSKCDTGVYDVIIIVTSAPENIDPRNAIRRSWGEHIPDSWNLLFFMGLTQSIQTNLKISEESNKFGDVIRGEFNESYKNLTLKTLAMIHWVRQSCSTPRYLLKVDDDVFLNIKKLANLIECVKFAEYNMYRNKNPDYETTFNADATIDTSANNSPFIVQEDNVEKVCEPWKPYDLISYYVSSKTNSYESYIAAGYLYKRVAPNRNPSSKWYIPYEVYPNPTLPNFLSGTSYLLSTNLLSHMLLQALDTPLIVLEDVYLTGLVGSNSLKLRLSHVNGWSNFRPRWTTACILNDLITAHGLDSDEMIHATKAVESIKTEEECNGRITKLGMYINTKVSYYFPIYKL